MGNIAWADKSIACAENKNLVSDNDLQFSGEHMPCLILTGMGMTRDTHLRSETHLQEAIFSSRIFAR
jgi:hypothetical protein